MNSEAEKQILTYETLKSKAEPLQTGPANQSERGRKNVTKLHFPEGLRAPYLLDYKMSAVSRMVTYLKTAWGKEPVIVSSIVIAIVAATMPWVSPYTRYTALMNKRMPYHYPVPVRDDGNMEDIPAHISDKEGERLEWLKK